MASEHSGKWLLWNMFVFVSHAPVSSISVIFHWVLVIDYFSETETWDQQIWVYNSIGS